MIFQCANSIFDMGSLSNIYLSLIRHHNTTLQQYNIRYRCYIHHTIILYLLSYIVILILYIYSYLYYNKHRKPINALLLMKVGDAMPTNEKELNCYLFDQLTLLEDIERVAKQTNASEVLDEIAIKRRQIERKLYQQPPLKTE